LSFQYDQALLPQSFDWLGFSGDNLCDWAGGKTSIINDPRSDTLSGPPVSAACAMPLPSWELNTLPTPITSQDQSEAPSVTPSSPENAAIKAHMNSLSGAFSKPEYPTTN